MAAKYKNYQQNAKSQIATKPTQANSQKLKTQMTPKLKHKKKNALQNFII